MPQQPRSKFALFIALASSAFVLAACYSPNPGDGKLPCSAEASCPSGYECASNGFCYQNGAAVPPDAPTAVAASPGVRSAQVSWTAPAQDGGSAITSYTVTASPGGATATSSSSSSSTSAPSSATVSGLQNGTAYTFTVVATNAIGNGPASAASASINTFGFPGAPSNVVATAGLRSASLDWSAPADAGGTPVTGYLVQVSLGGAAYAPVSASFSGTHATVTGLSNGGSYTFEVAAVNAVGAGNYSSASTAIVLADVPAMPVISAPAVVSTGETGVVASVTAASGETYAWTITGATLTNPSGAAGEIANGNDSITFTVTASSGGQLILSCVATNATGSSTAGTFTASVNGAPSQPIIVAADAVTLGDTGVIAKVIANTGMTYTWTTSSNVTLSGSDLHGATANGFNSITYSLNANAVAGDTVSLSVVEVNPAQQMSTPGTKSQTIYAAPSTPVISGPTTVTAGEVAAVASVTARAGMTYAWTLTGATFHSGTTSAGSTSGGTNSIFFDVSAGATSVVLSVVETNGAAKSGSAGTLAVSVGALPNPLTISVSLDNGASSAQFQTGQNQFVTQAAMSVIAEVSSIPGAVYSWSIPSGGGVAHSGETGASNTFLFDVNGTPGDSNTGTIALHCLVSIGSSSVSGDQTVTIVAAPAIPTVDIDGFGSNAFISVGDTTAHHATIASPVSSSTYAWSATPAADLAALASSGTSVSFALASSAPVNDAIDIKAIETNAAGRAGTTAGIATDTVVAAVAMPAIQASTSAVAPGQMYTASVMSAQTGATYQWLLVELTDGNPGAAVACPSTTPNLCTVNSNSISFTVDSALATDGHHALELELVASNQADSTSSATPVSLPVIALPNTTIHFGPPPNGDALGANITAGKTREAFIASGDATYQWTVSLGNTAIPGDITSGGTTDDVVFNAGTTAPPGPLALSVTATNAAGSSTGDANVNVLALAGAPTVSIPAYATDPAIAAYTNTTYTATLTPGTPAGTSYRWTVTTNGAGTCNADNSLCGVAAVGGSDPTGANFTYTVNAALNSTLVFSAVALNANGDPGPVSNTAVQTVIAAPMTPVIATTFTSPGAPSGVTFTAFAPLTTYTLAVATPHANMHYVWSNGSDICPGTSIFCTDASGTGSDSSIEVTIDSTIQNTSGASAHLGDQVSFSVAEVNRAGASASSVAALTTTLIAAPTAPAIGVVDHHMHVLDGTTYPLRLTGSTVAIPYTAQAYVSAVVNQTNAEDDQQYLWTALDSNGQASVIDGASTASGAITTLPMAYPQTPIDAVTIDVPAYSSMQKVQLKLTTWNAAAFASATEVDVPVEVPAIAPVIDVAKVDSDVRTPKALTYGATGIEALFPFHMNIDETDMTYGCTGDLAVNGGGGTGTDHGEENFLFDVNTLAEDMGTTPVSTTLTCTETNSLGDLATGSLTIPLHAPLSVAIVPNNGAIGVGYQPTMTLTLSYPPDPTTVSAVDPISMTCGSGSVTIFQGTVASPGACVPFTIAPDSINAALYNITPTSPLTASTTYTLTVTTGGVADLQGVPLDGVSGSADTSTFTVQAVPDIDPASVVVSPHLQSIDLSWTNPSDPNLNHVLVCAQAAGATACSGQMVSTSSSPNSLTISGLAPLTSYDFNLYVFDGGGAMSAGISKPGQSTAFSGVAADFLSGQTAPGLLAAPFNGGAGSSFSLAWDANNLYLGFEQSDGAANALRFPGDALWVGIDVDGSGTGADTNGESSTVTGGSASAASDQMIWPFKADYVIELKLQAVGTLVANLRTVANAPGSQWAAIPTPIDANSILAELVVPASLIQTLGGSPANPTAMRFAMAFLNAPLSGNAKVIDLAPAAYADPSSDGHMPATDVLGELASITNSIDPKGVAFSTSSAATSMSGSVRTPAPSLVTVSLDASAAAFGATDVVQMEGSIPPLSYVLSDSSYALADDGTRGSTNSAGHYTGVFNFGGASGELFFKFVDTTAGTSPVVTVEPLFAATGSNPNDRVWTLAGSSEIIGDRPIGMTTGPFDPIVFNQVYGATHDFTLDFVVSGVPSNTGVEMLGDQNILGDWTSGSGRALVFQSGTTWAALNVPFGPNDFVSGGVGCSNPQGSPDPTGCALNFKGRGFTSSFEGFSGNHLMNDDVINHRSLSWTWGNGVSF